MDLQKANQWIDENEELISDISKKIWDYAEVAFKVVKSAELVAQSLDF